MNASDLQALIQQGRNGVTITDAQSLQKVVQAAGVEGLMTIRVEVSEVHGDLLQPRTDLLLYGLYDEPEIQASSPAERIRLTAQAVDEMLEIAAREDAAFQFELWLDSAADDAP